MILIPGHVLGFANEEVLASGGGDGLIKLWRLNKAAGGAIEELHQLDDGRDEGHSVLSLSLDGNFLYSGHLNGEIHVWDLETKQLVRNLKSVVGDVLALSIGGGYLFSAGDNGIVQVGEANLDVHKFLTPIRNSTVSMRQPPASRPTMGSYLPLPSRPLMAGPYM